MNSLLTTGKIPAGSTCPFAGKCDSKLRGQCAHTGVTHTSAFSCGYARLFDLDRQSSVRFNSASAARHGPVLA